MLHVLTHSFPTRRSSDLRGRAMNDVSELLRSRKYDQGRTWSAWPAYEAAESGLLYYWYPAAWASELGKNPTPARICAVTIMHMRDEEGQVRALRALCSTRGLQLSPGGPEFRNPISQQQ